MPRSLGFWTVAVNQPPAKICMALSIPPVLGGPLSGPRGNDFSVHPGVLLLSLLWRSALQLGQLRQAATLHHSNRLRELFGL